LFEDFPVREIPAPLQICKVCNRALSRECIITGTSICDTCATKAIDEFAKGFIPNLFVNAEEQVKKENIFFAKKKRFKNLTSFVSGGLIPLPEQCSSPKKNKSEVESLDNIRQVRLEEE
jgi:hypothetical protein